MINGSHSEERRAKIAASIKAKWQDPSYRERTLEGIRAAQRPNANKTVPEASRRKIAETMKRKWQSAEYRENQIRAMELRRQEQGKDTRVRR